MTSVSFSAEDLADVGQLLAVGQAVLHNRPPVVPRLKAAITTVGVASAHLIRRGRERPNILRGTAHASRA